MKLNLGCGFNPESGWTNVDKFASPGVDQVVDLEVFPWPWADNSVDEIVLNHVLEHLGRETEVFFGIIKELWRVCKPGAAIQIAVPHPRHDFFLWDPTHVRPITYETLAMFDLALNREWVANGNAMTKLAMHLGVDFKVEAWRMELDDAWEARRVAGNLSDADLQFAIRAYNNVVKNLGFLWRVRK